MDEVEKISSVEKISRDSRDIVEFSICRLPRRTHPHRLPGEREQTASSALLCSVVGQESYALCCDVLLGDKG
jgi:hypothetical protein